jgi:hypothetical protein
VVDPVGIVIADSFSTCTFACAAHNQRHLMVS